MQGIDGFLQTRASIMVDVVALAMVLVLVVMCWSILQVKNHQRYQLHKRIQVTLGIVLAITVTLFEIDIQYLSKWRPRAEASPYYSSDAGKGLVNWSLYLHLVFAVSSAVLWVFVIVQALRKIPSPPGPCAYSRTHIFWARLAAIDMTLTTFTGWLFYYFAFVA